MSQVLSEILTCPLCRVRLLCSGPSEHCASLACPECHRIYPVLNGIPDMLPEMIAGRLASGDQQWNAWSAKLENFVRWREMTWNGSSSAEKLNSYATDLKKRFAEFTGLRNSGKTIVDIGCGDGGMVRFLGACNCYGIDPLLIEDHQYDFPLVRGVGEYLPFPDGFFDAAILNQVLDHCSSIDGVLQEAVRVVGATGTVNVMQYVSLPDNLPSRIYQRLLKGYLSIRNVQSLDTKTRRLEAEGLEQHFRERFERVDVFAYSASQIFIRASCWLRGKGTGA